MKFYEFNNEDYAYYALIGACTEKEAKEFYDDNVAYIEGNEKNKNPRELKREEAYNNINRYYKVPESMHEYNRDHFNKAIDSEETTLFALDRDLM
ncbi:hypothetical protein [Clostridium butyricum]|uniref:hypothetical protein n=1 Tax=Clostridium butyricum TaxID=1492 RepID=UPI0029145932|nr:hypothetical protein [Clostridium butyricum]MDU3584428.1 hypothetical protein [Clostridium butyricum]MDU3597726.1 hypothetical protein [Clostridium butyricum]